MQAESEVVDLYRCMLMQDQVGEVYEARVSGIAGSGVYAVLDEPFVDVLLRFEALGPDRYEAGDDGLSVVGRRSGDRISLGDRVTLVIEDVALLRRTIYGRRVPPAQVLADAEAAAVSEQFEPRPALVPPGRRARFGGARSDSSAPRPGRFGRGKGPAKGQRGAERAPRPGEHHADDGSGRRRKPRGTRELRPAGGRRSRRSR
jgi:ribonuclease R